MATVKSADKIVAVQKGRVVEEGTWADLIAKDSYFASLVALSQTDKADEDQATDQVEKQDNIENAVEKSICISTGDEAETSFDEFEASFMDLMKLNSPETIYIVIGCLAALVNGAVEPIFAISMADFIKAFSEYEYGSEELDNEILLWSGIAGGIGVLLLIFNVIEYGALGKAGEELTMRLRQSSNFMFYKSTIFSAVVYKMH